MTKPADFNSRLYKDINSVPLSRAKLLIHDDKSHIYLELYYGGKRIGSCIYVTFDRTDVDGNYELVYLSRGDAYTCLLTCVDDVLKEYFNNLQEEID